MYSLSASVQELKKGTWANETASYCRLECSVNSLTALPDLPPTLKILVCSQNYLDRLPSLPPRLELLSFANNYVREVPELPQYLTALNCCLNPPLTALPRHLPPHLQLLEYE
jgi:Leucine-rich repeat (LRR) protein